MLSYATTSLCCLLIGSLSCSSPASSLVVPQDNTATVVTVAAKPKVLQLPLRARIGTLDPVNATSSYDSQVQSQIFEGLYSYKYLVRPFEIQPLLAKSLPRVSPDGLTYTIDLREDVLFHDDPCFANGKSRLMVADDVVYSLKRLADSHYRPTGWWIYADRIVGFDDYRERITVQGQREAKLNTDIVGLKAIDTFRLQIELIRPWPQLLHALAHGYSSIVPRECVEKYDGLRLHPIGTGPFMLREWAPTKELILDRNPKYRDQRYPKDANPEYKGMLVDKNRRIPFLDSIVYSFYEDDSLMWENFKKGELHMTQLPAEFHKEVYNKTGEVRESSLAANTTVHTLPLIDFVYRGFNMADPIVGIGDRAKYLRQAISLAVDTDEINKTFYNNTCVLYDGPVPPGLASYEPGVTSSYRGPDLEAAKRLMVKAGYPNGKKLPPLHYYTSNGGNSTLQAEVLRQALAQIGITLEIHPSSFAVLFGRLKQGKAQMFSLAWGADYPDAENFLQLFFGPNASPGSNVFNYNNSNFDALFIKSQTMQPGPEQIELYNQMRTMLIEDVPTFGHMARTRYYLWHNNLRNALPSEIFAGWVKYLDLNLDH